MTLKLKSALLTLEELKVTKLAYKQKICKNYTYVEALHNTEKGIMEVVIFDNII